MHMQQLTIRRCCILSFYGDEPDVLVELEKGLASKFLLMSVAVEK